MRSDNHRCAIIEHLIFTDKKTITRYVNDQIIIIYQTKPQFA